MNKKLYVMLLCTLLFAPFITVNLSANDYVIVEVSCLNYGEYTDEIITTVSSDGMMLTIEFNPPLPDQDCCTIKLNGAIEDSFTIRTLAGDVNHDGVVSTGDASIIKPWYNHEVNENTFIYDINTNGSITSDDYDSCVSKFGHSAPSCQDNSPSYIIGARSIINHDGLEYDLNLTSNNIEHRLAGVTKIEFDLITSIKYKLIIDAPDFITEEEDFNTIITANDVAIADVDVTFNEVTRSTNDNGIVTFTAPSFIEGGDNEYLITATHLDYIDADPETIIIVEVSDLKELVINAPSSVMENESFDTIVTSNGEPIENVNVTFNDKNKITDSNGLVSFTAPNVTTNTQYAIIAKSEGYEDDETTIMVLNKKERQGWIYGVVFSISTSLPIENVKIEASKGQKSWSVYTDENGRYLLSIPVGIYNLVASKEGYEASTKNNITIDDKTAVEVNFILESTESRQPTGVIDFLIQNQIKEGRISAEIDPKELHVTLYSDEVDVNITESKELSKGGISLIIAGEGPGTIIAVYLNLSDKEELVVTYDGEEINETTDLESFFNNNNNESVYVLLPSTDLKNVLFILIPEFSEHIITISSIEEAVNIITTLLTYLAILVIVGLAIIAPIVYIDRKEREE
jgi:hypothetical protein